MTVDHDHAAHSADCRVCRMGADLNRIRAIGQPRTEPEPVGDARIAQAHDYAARFLWTESQRACIRKAVEAGATLAQFLRWVNESARDVGRRDR